MELEPDFRERGEFPTERPMDALKTDHALVRRLFVHYFDAQDGDSRREYGQHLIALLNMHTMLEEQVFYRYVHTAAPDLVDRCIEEHAQMQELIAQIEASDLAGADGDALLRRLSGLVVPHLDEEEQQLFPQVEQMGIDLAALGREMQTFELTQIADRTQKPIAPGLRR